MTIEITRKLASIQRITNIIPIENADSICQYEIDHGWKVVDKIDAHQIGDLVIYLEIDSWCPHSLAPFLSKGKEPRIYDGIKGERLKTVRLRGALSQGLILPIDHLDYFDTEENVWYWASGMYREGDDVTEILGIVKYEPPIPAQLQGKVKGNFPSCVKKTDQTRIQGMFQTFSEWLTDPSFDPSFVIEEKLDGTSFTCFIDPMTDEFSVCSRNMNLKETEGNTYWEIARKCNLEIVLRKLLPRSGLALQGEIVGHGIQKNLYGLPDHQLFIFDIWDIRTQTYLSFLEREQLSKDAGLSMVPVIGMIDDTEQSLSFIEDDSEQAIKRFMDWSLEFAEGKSVLNPKTEREGLVFKNLKDPLKSFKTVSNRFLQKHDA